MLSSVKSAEILAHAHEELTVKNITLLREIVLEFNEKAAAEEVRSGFFKRGRG